MTPSEAATAAGPKYRQIYDDDNGLLTSDKDEFLLRSELIAEPPASYPSRPVRRAG